MLQVGFDLGFLSASLSHPLSHVFSFCLLCFQDLLPLFRCIVTDPNSGCLDEEDLGHAVLTFLIVPLLVLYAYSHPFWRQAMTQMPEVTRAEAPVAHRRRIPADCTSQCACRPSTVSTLFRVLDETRQRRGIQGFSRCTGRPHTTPSPPCLSTGQRRTFGTMTFGSTVSSVPAP